MRKIRRRKEDQAKVLELIEKIDKIIDKYEERFKDDHKVLIELFQDINQEFKYIPEESLTRISKRCEVPLSKLFSLATFYDSFRMEKIGKHHICVCSGTTCHINGSDKVINELKNKLGIEPGHTTEDGNWTFETVHCFGVCAHGPLVEIDGKYYHQVDSKKINEILKKYENNK